MQFGIPGRDDSESMFPPIESFDRRIIDSLSAQIAILNKRGIILETNQRTLRGIIESICKT